MKDLGARVRGATLTVEYYLTIVIDSSISYSNNEQKGEEMENSKKEAQEFLKKFMPKPHWFKAVLKEHGIPLSAVVNYLGLSYGYVSNMMSGVINMTDENEAKLRKLKKRIEEE